MADRERPQRVLVVGLDGGTFVLLRPWLEDGTLPCLARLYREGVRGILHSVVPPLSPEAWSTFMTGKHPGRHGVMNFLSFRAGSHELHFNSGADVREPTLWKLASDAGRKVGVVAVPMTYPPEQVNGYLISGLETPGVKSQFTYPPELSDELRRAVGGYDLHGDLLRHTTPEAYVQRVRGMVESQARCVTYLFDHYPADLSMVVIGATDRIQHCFWRFLDPGHPRHEPGSRPALRQAIREVYQRVDAAVGEIISRVPDPKTVLIMSDHGFGPCSRSVHLNQWLEAQGYLVCSRTNPLFGAARGAWHRLGPLLPRWLRDWLKSKLPSVRRQVQSFLLLSQVDWSRTRAFSLSTESGYVYLNRTDRFPHGTVSPGAQAAALCGAIARDLEGLRDAATGEPVVGHIHRVDDLYSGPARRDLPDLLVVWRDGYISRMDSSGARGRRPAEVVEPRVSGDDMHRHIAVEQSGSHRPDGILIAHGPAVAGPGEVQGARLVDLAPTILYLLGESVPSDMQGRVLEGIIDPDLLAASPVQYREPQPAAPQATRRDSPYSPEEAAQLEHNLRDLGYLE